MLQQRLFFSRTKKLVWSIGRESQLTYPVLSVCLDVRHGDWCRALKGADRRGKAAGKERKRLLSLYMRQLKNQDESEKKKKSEFWFFFLQEERASFISTPSVSWSRRDPAAT